MKSTTCFRLFLHITSLTLLVGLLASLLPIHALGQIDLPLVWDILADDFEGGNFDKWQISSSDCLNLLSGGGNNGTIGLSVTVRSSPCTIYQTEVAKAKEGYLSFWFNPNGVSIPDSGTSWIPGKSLSIADVVNSTNWWPQLVAIYVHRPSGQGYKAYLSWPLDSSNHINYDFDNSFDLLNGWQQIIVGFRINEWVAVWHNGVLMRYATNVVHNDPYADVVHFGKIRDTSNNSSGAIRFDDVAFQIPRIEDLYVDANNGDDNNDGLTSASAFRTVQKAGDLAGPGTTVHILPGIYRETVEPVLNGSLGEPVQYIAEYGSGTVSIRGSEPSSSLSWTPLSGNTIGLPPGVNPANIYYTDLSTWNLNDPPRFIVELEESGQVAVRLPMAREPDWNVVNEWKYHEYWWAANGGSSVAGCNPITNPNHQCDEPWRSFTQLTDTRNDTDPIGIEPGNLTTLGNLTGATLVAMDTYHAHYMYRRTITQHNVTAGRVTVNENCNNDGDPGLGWGSKYYVENHPALLDQPGEWWFDKSTGKLYFWSLTGENPSYLKLEISRLDTGFDLTNRSYIILNGLRIDLYNHNAYKIDNTGQLDMSYGNQLRNSILQYANKGIVIYQNAQNTKEKYAVDGFLLENSEIAYMDTTGFDSSFSWPEAPSPVHFSHAGVRNIIIRNNEFHHLGFNSMERSAVGIRIFYPDKIRFQDNYIHHVAQNGAQFHLSLIDSGKVYNFTPQEIKLGEILIKGNIFEKACQAASDCGGLKIGGSSRPDTHVFRDVLILWNIFRHNFGWSYVSIQRQLNTLGDGNGFYLDYASGVHAYRNIAYNNSGTGFKLSCLWRDGDAVFINNTSANNYLYGFKFTGPMSCDDHNGSVNTQVANNILINNGAYGFQFISAYANQYGNLLIDHNLYFQNGWDDHFVDHPVDIQLYRDSLPVAHLSGLVEIRDETPWEVHGTEGDPDFFTYDISNHNHYTYIWPDFHLTAASIHAIDQGTTTLPASLSVLLDKFGISDYHLGSAFDIGRYEAGFMLVATPTSQSIDPGGTAYYTLSLFPSDTPSLVTLSFTNPSPYLDLDLSPTEISGEQVATLTVNDTHAGTLIPGEWYVLPITGEGSGFIYTTNLGLVVGGVRVFLPLIRN